MSRDLQPIYAKSFVNRLHLVLQISKIPTKKLRQKRRRNSARSRGPPSLPAAPFPGPACHPRPPPPFRPACSSPAGWGQALPGGRGIASVTPATASWPPCPWWWGCGWALGLRTLACTPSVLPALERSARSHRRVGPESCGPTDRETGSECPCGGIEAPRCCPQ